VTESGRYVSRTARSSRGIAVRANVAALFATRQPSSASPGAALTGEPTTLDS
jgi:hypothetical protein